VSASVCAVQGGEQVGFQGCRHVLGPGVGSQVHCLCLLHCPGGLRDLGQAAAPVL
jgi:hypothetical protein